jgi:hypothetical protein
MRACMRVGRRFSFPLTTLRVTADFFHPSAGMVPSPASVDRLLSRTREKPLLVKDKVKAVDADAGRRLGRWACACRASKDAAAGS